MADSIGAVVGRSRSHDPWLAPLMGLAVLVAIAVYAVRPMVSYRALSLGAGPFELGMIASCFSSLAIVVALPLGGLIDRIGERRILIAGTACSAVACLAVPLAGSIPALAATQAMLGLGQLTVIVGSHTMLASRGSAERRAWRVGGYMSLTALGRAVGPGAAGLIAGSSITADPIGVVFLGAAAVAFVAFVFAVSLPHPINAAASAAAAAPPRPGIATVLRVPGMPSALLAGVCVLVSLDLFGIYLPAYGEERGLTPEVIGLGLMALALAQMVSRLGLGWLVGKFGHFGPIVTCLVLAAAVVPLLVLEIDGGGLIAILALAGFGLGLVQPLTFVWVAARTPQERQGSVMSLRMGLSRLGELAIPPLIGAVAGQAGMVAVVWSISAILLVGTGAISRARNAIELEPAAEMPGNANLGP